MFSPRSIGPTHFKAAQLEAKSQPFTVVSVCITYISRILYCTLSNLLMNKISKYDEMRARLSVGMLRKPQLSPQTLYILARNYRYLLNFD